MQPEMPFYQNMMLFCIIYMEIHVLKLPLKLDDIIHGHLEVFYYLKLLSFYFIFSKTEKV
jgi:hypothetical protein